MPISFEALRYPFELNFCGMVKDIFANFFPKNHATRQLLPALKILVNRLAKESLSSLNNLEKHQGLYVRPYLFGQTYDT